MRTPLLMTMALVPVALIAQAPAPMTFSQRLKAQGPEIEQLLKDFKPQEAMAKAEALLPEAQPVFDKSSLNAGRAASFQFSDLARTYHLAGKASVAAGFWEKGQGYFTKAKEIANLNAEETSALVTPAIAAWEGPVAAAKQALEAGATRFAELSAKKEGLTPEETTELANFNTHKANIENGAKVAAVLHKDVASVKAERDAFGPMIEGAEKAIAAEKEEVDREVASKKFKGDREKYFAATLNPKNLESRTTKQDRMNFLNRLLFHCKGTAQASKVQAVIDRVRKDQDPFPSASKASKKKKAK